MSSVPGNRMKESAVEISLSAVRAGQARPARPAPLREDAAFVPQAISSAPPTGVPTAEANRKSPARFFCDPWRILLALKRRYRLLMGAAVASALATGGFGYLQSNFQVRVTLIEREASPALAANAENENYRPRALTPPTLLTLMQSPGFLRRVAADIEPSLSAASLQERVRIEQVPNTDLVGITVEGKQRPALVALANALASEAVALGREIQVAEAEQTTRFCRDKLAALDAQLQQASTELTEFQNTEKLADPDAEKQGYIRQLGDLMARADNARIEAELLDLQVETLRNELAQQNTIAQKLEAARSKLTDLMGQYTEIHPIVQSQRRAMAELEKQLLAAGSSTLAAAKYSDNPQVSAMYGRLVDLQTRKATAQKVVTEVNRLRALLLGKITGLSEKSLKYATIKAQLDGLQKSRSLLASREREAQLYQENSQGYHRIFAPATLKDVDVFSRWLAALAAGSIGLVLGGLGAGLIIAAQEVTDRRLKTAVDVQRATELPVLASLGDLDQMSQAEKDAWAFRTWTSISGQLNASPNHGIVCGFTSSNAGEGRSTWIELLVGAAKQRGLQVMTIATRPGKASPAPMDFSPGSDTPKSSATGGTALTRRRTAPGSQTELAIASNPGLVRNPTLTAHIPLPGKVWDLAQRRKWQNTLAQMSRIDSLVLLVELPPASMPEAVLLAESLPQVIWLADSGRAGGKETREQLQTLRHAKCRLVGAVLNHAPKEIFAS